LELTRFNGQVGSRPGAAGPGSYIGERRIQDGGQPQTALAVFRGTSGTLLERLHPFDLDTEPSIPVVVAGREDDLHVPGGAVQNIGDVLEALGVGVRERIVKENGMGGAPGR
jgi:hypothetical protein